MSEPIADPVMPKPAIVVETVIDPPQAEPAFMESFRDAMTDEDLKGNQMWENLKGKNADEVGQYFKELKSFTGKKGDIPKEDASEDEWNAFYEKLGRPEKIEGYEFNLNTEFKELVGESAVPFFEEAVGWFKDEAFAAGLSPEKADAMLDGYLGMVAKQTTDGQVAIAERAKENETALRTEWGANYDGIYEGNLAILKSNGMSEDDVKALESSGVLKSPSLAIALGKIAAKFGDDPEIGHQQTMTMSGTQDQLDSVNAEFKEHLIKGDPAPAHLKQKRLDLMNKLGENMR